MKNHKIVRLILISILLFYGIYLSSIYLHELDPSPSILIKGHDSSSISGLDVLPGRKIFQEIKSPYNNLGIVAVRFQTYKRINDDTLTFRIRQKDNLKWLYVAKYKTDQFQDREFFPFGFPPITNSKNQTYEFEIESSTGSAREHVSIDYLKPSVLTKYQYPIRQYDPRSTLLYTFIVLKIGNFLTNYALLFPIICYFIPLVYFLLHNQITKSKIFSPYLLILFPLTVYVIQTAASLSQPPYWLMTMIIFWGLYILINRLDSKINLAIALCFIPPIILQLIEKDIESAELYAYWLFVFLIFGYVHSFLISFLNLKNLVGVEEYFSAIFKPPR